MTTTETVVHRQVTVDAPIGRAFEVFVGRFGDFKPREHNLLGAEIVETRFQRHGSGWGGVRDGVAEDGGWPLYLSHYADVVAGS